MRSEARVLEYPLADVLNALRLIERHDNDQFARDLTSDFRLFLEREGFIYVPLQSGASWRLTSAGQKMLHEAGQHKARQAVQIISTSFGQIAALADDGTIWERIIDADTEDYRWRQLAPLPQD